MRAIGISLLLALIPIGFIVYMVFTGDIGVPPHWTVDGLFLTLILLTISGIMLLNAVMEAHNQGLIRLPGFGHAAVGATAGGGTMAFPDVGGPAGELRTDVGVIEKVEYYDAPVGQPNKSIVTLRDGKAARNIVFGGNLRSLLIEGRKMKLTYFPQSDGAQLVSFDFR